MILQTPQELLKFRAPHCCLLGLDVGTKTIGLALSDTRWVIASPFKTLLRAKFAHTIDAFKEIFCEFNVAGLVIGLPLNMDGSRGPRCQSVQQFAQNLDKNFGLPLCFWDERLSTMAVTRTLREAHISRKRRTEVVDKMAASFILQGALDSLSAPPL